MPGEPYLNWNAGLRVTACCPAPSALDGSVLMVMVRLMVESIGVVAVQWLNRNRARKEMGRTYNTHFEVDVEVDIEVVKSRFL